MRASPRPLLPWLGAASLFGSGRGAIAGLVAWGVAVQRWRRIWLPSYNCPEVPAALLAMPSPTGTAAGVELCAYPDASLQVPSDLDAIPVGAGDAVVVVNQLGVRPRPDIAGLRRRGAIIIEDHSHDPASPWALRSDADFAFASLRKTLPIEDGGAVWSPLGLDLPPAPEGPASAAADRVASRLAGRAHALPDDRLRFRALARASGGGHDVALAAPISPVARALLPQMPVLAWRERRRQNVARLAGAVASAAGVRVLSAPDGAVPFALTMIFDEPHVRAAAQRALASRAVVPVVLWPLDAARDWGVGPADAALSDRILSVHGDQRYDADDMERLAAILAEAVAG